MTILDSTNPSTKLEETSPRTALLDIPPNEPTPLRRAWSCGMLDEMAKRPNLPDLLSASNKCASKRQGKAYQAAVRAVANNLRKSKSKSPNASEENSRPTAQSRHSNSPHVVLNRPSISASPPLASGPAAGLQRQPGTYETVEQINNRFNRQSSNLPIYLIRTDLRYAPTLDMVTVYMELPGLRLEDVSLKIGNRSNGIRHLVVTAVSRPPTHSRDEMAMQERVFGVFSRTLIVPPHVQASDIRAEMANGLLILQIPGSKFEAIAIQPRE